MSAKIIDCSKTLQVQCDKKRKKVSAARLPFPRWKSHAKLTT